jgi:hypothetical protein
MTTRTRIAAAVAALALTFVGTACQYPLRPERCAKAILVIDGQAYVSCQSGLRPIPGK